MAYGDFKDLNRRKTADKILSDKAFKRKLASMVYKFFNKKTSGGAVKNEIISYKKLANELHKPIIRKFEKKKYTHL